MEFKMQILAAIACKRSQAAILLGVEPVVVDELLAAHAPNAAYVDGRVVMATAYVLESVLILINEETYQL
eukprot:6034486-Amphidinium_carterae.1